MSTAKKEKPAGKKTIYRVLAVRNQVFEFEVTAMSPEGACKTLQERLRMNNTFDVPHKAKPQLSTWSNPNEPGEEWIIEGGEIVRDLSGKNCMIWNGSEILPKKIKIADSST